ncbi:MAG: M56 family metallopeptidase, partial [Lysobacter sp.]
MNPADAMSLLAEATIASSVAIAIVLLVRQPLRARFGAGIAYATWLLVPAALTAVLLPATTVTTPVPVVLQLERALPSTIQMDAAMGIDPTMAIMVAWLVGMLLAIAWFALQQHRFRHALGILRARADGMQQASSVSGLPAAFGLLRP